MSQFRAHLLELAEKFKSRPDAKLVISVPISSLHRREPVSPYTVCGDWTLAVADGVELSGEVASVPAEVAEDGLAKLLAKLNGG